MSGGSLQVRRGVDRSVTEAEGRRTAHSFSFGAHYDPENLGLGPMRAHNDERLPPGTGYDDHEHRAVEIVTVVLEGRLRHRSSVGSAVLGPGEVQRLRAGPGVVHAETAVGPDAVRFLQTWLRSPEVGPPAAPTYATHAPVAGAVVPLAGPGTPLDLEVPGTLTRVRLRAGEEITLPAAGVRHLFVVSGSAEASHGGAAARLGPDDAARVVGLDDVRLRAHHDVVALLWCL